MTLPEMMRRALRLQRRDPSLRLVYPAGGWEIEQSTEPGLLIPTLRTPDNFQVSFAVTDSDLQEMAAAAAQGGAVPVPLHSRAAGVH